MKNVMKTACRSQYVTLVMVSNKTIPCLLKMILIIFWSWSMSKFKRTK